MHQVAILPPGSSENLPTYGEFKMKTYFPASLSLFSLLAAAATCLGVCLDLINPIFGLSAITALAIVFINAVYMIEG